MQNRKKGNREKRRKTSLLPLFFFCSFVPLTFHESYQRQRIPFKIVSLALTFFYEHIKIICFLKGKSNIVYRQQSKIGKIYSILWNSLVYYFYYSYFFCRNCSILSRQENHSSYLINGSISLINLISFSFFTLLYHPVTIAPSINIRSYICSTITIKLIIC